MTEIINGAVVLHGLDSNGVPRPLLLETDGSISGGGGGLYTAYAQIIEQQNQNVEAGTFTSGARRTRVLNTVVEDDDDIVTSLVSNQFVLPAGSYRVRIEAPAYNCGRHRAWLRNITAGADSLKSKNTFVTSANMSDAIVDGSVTIAVATTFEVQHRCETTSNTFGLGVASNFDVEIYTVVHIWKKA